MEEFNELAHESFGGPVSCQAYAVRCDTPHIPGLVSECMNVFYIISMKCPFHSNHITFFQILEGKIKKAATHHQPSIPLWSA